jgi:hypothetical protein
MSSALFVPGPLMPQRVICFGGSLWRVQLLHVETIVVVHLDFPLDVVEVDLTILCSTAQDRPVVHDIRLKVELRDKVLRFE